jgi:hypothetical protein
VNIHPLFLTLAIIETILIVGLVTTGHPVFVVVLALQAIVLIAFAGLYVLDLHRHKNRSH